MAKVAGDLDSPEKDESQPKGAPQPLGNGCGPATPPDQVEPEESLRKRWEDAKNEILDLGGWEGFKSGSWLLRLIQKSFRSYFARANAEYFRKKYQHLDTEAIVSKLIKVASRNSAVLGAVVGAAVSTDEIIAVITGFEGGAGLPVNVGVAIAAVTGEAVQLVRIQVQLVANLAKLYGVPLDPDDPEDVLTILAFAVGGSVADLAGKAGMKIGGRVTEKGVRRYVSKQVLAAVKSIGRRLGIKILQRTIIKYAVPLVCMGIGSGWNLLATRKVGSLARKHFIARASELRPPETAA